VRINLVVNGAVRSVSVISTLGSNNMRTFHPKCGNIVVQGGAKNVSTI